MPPLPLSRLVLARFLSAKHVMLCHVKPYFALLPPVPLPLPTSPNPAFIHDMVACGCEPNMMGKFGGAGGSEAVRGNSSSSKFKTRHSIRGVDGNGNRSGEGEAFVAAAAAKGGAVVSRALEDTP